MDHAMPSSYDKDYLLGKPLRLAVGTHLLANRDLIEDHWNITWHVGRPELRDPPLVFDVVPSWADAESMAKVLRDSVTGRFRMWYLAFNWTSYWHFFAGKSEPGPLPGAYCVAYAESDDGVQWHRPELDVWTTPDGQRTNIVHWGLQGGQLGDVVENVPGSRGRFTMVYLDHENGSEGICLASSDDGIHWRRDPANPVLQCVSDCQNNIVFDARAQRYVLLTRPYPHASGIYEWDPPGNEHMRRRIAVSTSVDLRNWTPIRVAIFPEHDDLPDFDNLTAFAYGNDMVGLLHVFDASAGREQRMTSYLALSSDGLNWQRIKHEPFMTQGFSGLGFDDHSISVSGTCLPLDDNLLAMFYIGNSSKGDSPYKQVRLASITLRRDGFAYAEPAPPKAQQVVRDNLSGQTAIKPAGDGRGYLLTREFILPAPHLSLNVDARNGHGVTYELVNHRTTVAYPGFESECCEPITGDAIRAPLRWRGADLSRLVGEPVMLRLILSAGARVYAVHLH